MAGDQHWYIAAYNKISQFSLSIGKVADAHEFYRNSLGSKELIHFIVIWIGSSLAIPKAPLMAVFNGTLVYACLALLRRLKVSLFIAIVLVLSNFYIHVLFFAAERLKFGVLFTVTAFCVTETTIPFIGLFLLACASHLQVVIFYPFAIIKGLQTNQIFADKNRFFRVLVLASIFGAILATGFASLLFEHAQHKFSKYTQYGEAGVMGLAKSLVFCSATILYAKDKRMNATLVFVPLLLAAFFLGGTRVNMMVYFVFLYYVAPINKGWNLPILVSTLYFANSTYVFWQRFLGHGEGFN